MANLEERVTDLEGHTGSLIKAIDDLRGELRASVAQLRGEMALRSDLADVRMEMGDLRNDTNRRLDLLDAKIDRHFVWLMGMMVTGFITVIGALVGVVDR